MAGRRDFLRSLAVLAAPPGSWPSVGAQHAAPLPIAGGPPAPTDRQYWLDVLTRLAEPVLTNLAEGRLRQRLPVEIAPAGNPERRDYTHLEAVGCLFTGIAPWLELGGDASPEGEQRQRYADLARRGLRTATDPRSPDFLNFARGRQPLVDAAFLAHAIVRAPRELWQRLDGETQPNVGSAPQTTRGIRPSISNWLMFSRMIGTPLGLVGGGWDRTRVDHALTQHEQWYKGDGVYGDGPTFHWDYYNSFVIQPMLLDVLRLVGPTTPAWQRLIDRKS